MLSPLSGLWCAIYLGGNKIISPMMATAAIRIIFRISPPFPDRFPTVSISVSFPAFGLKAGYERTNAGFIDQAANRRNTVDSAAARPRTIFRAANGAYRHSRRIPHCRDRSHRALRALPAL